MGRISLMFKSPTRRPGRLAFTDRWRPLRETMVFARRYHPNLAMTLPEKRGVLDEQGAIAVWMYELSRPRRLIGETYGVPVQAVLAEEDSEGKADLRPFAKQRALYVYSTTVLRQYEGGGLGKILKAYLLGRAFEAGYRWAVGHANKASLPLNLQFGARRGRRHGNWSGTGTSYWFYTLRLR